MEGGGGKGKRRGGQERGGKGKDECGRRKGGGARGKEDRGAARKEKVNGGGEGGRTACW